MPNQITLPKGFQTILDETYKMASVTSVLDSSPTDLKPTQNVNEFCYPQLEVGGLGDYDRASGYTANSGVKLDWKTVQADYDRGTKIMVDVMDNQESFDLAFGKAAGELLRTHVAPEGDAFTFAKIAGLSGIGNDTATIENGSQFLEAILAASTEMDEDEVPAEQRYLFTTSTLLSSVKALDTTKSREALDGFAGIVKVPRGRFYTAIDLLDGRSEGELDGGWRPSTGGYQKTADTTVVSGKDYYTKSGTSLITSQNVTAPKLVQERPRRLVGLITSQNVTAPKLDDLQALRVVRLITSQNVTAPKHQPGDRPRRAGLITSQNVTAPKQRVPVA